MAASSSSWSSVADGETKNAAAASQKRSAVNASLIMVQKVPPINPGLSLSNGRNGRSGCHGYQCNVEQ